MKVQSVFRFETSQCGLSNDALGLLRGCSSAWPGFRRVDIAHLRRDLSGLAEVVKSPLASRPGDNHQATWKSGRSLSYFIVFRTSTRI